MFQINSSRVGNLTKRSLFKSRILVSTANSKRHGSSKYNPVPPDPTNPNGDYHDYGDNIIYACVAGYVGYKLYDNFMEDRSNSAKFKKLIEDRGGYKFTDRITLKQDAVVEVANEENTQTVTETAIKAESVIEPEKEQVAIEDAPAEKIPDASDANPIPETTSDPEIQLATVDKQETLVEQAIKADSDPEIEKIKVDPNELPPHVPYLLIGGGIASFMAQRTICNNDPGTKVLIVTDEEHPPYRRPPLSKDLWFSGNSENFSKTLSYKSYSGRDLSILADDSFHFAAPGELMHYDGTKVGLAVNAKVSHLESDTNTAVFTDGRKVTFDKCLVAIGGVPKKLEALNEINQENVTYFRKLNDFIKLEENARNNLQNKKIAVIGGGFLGSEIAIGLAQNSKKYDTEVVNIIKESGNLGAFLPEYLAEWSTATVEKQNVKVIPNASVNTATQNKQTGKINLTLSNGDNLECDHVIAAVGLEIPKDFAEKSNIEYDNKLGGYVVNSELQARRNVWVAGDATSFYDIKLGRRRVEHHDHAVVSGRLAGGNMSGTSSKPFWHQSFFWSDLGPDVGFTAMGLIDSKQLKTIGVFESKANEGMAEWRTTLHDDTETHRKHSQNSNGKGVVFYLNDNNTIVGMVCWNIHNKMNVCRKIIADQINASDEKVGELAKLFFSK